MEMIENWKNNEQSEQNNSKVPVDFTSGKKMAHKVCCASLFAIFSSLLITPVSPHHLFISLVGLQEMLHWFTKEKHHSIEDLVKSAIKLSVSDVLDTDKASLIPEVLSSTTKTLLLSLSESVQFRHLGIQQEKDALNPLVSN